MRTLRIGGLALLSLAPALAGCNIVGPILFFASPPQIQKADFKLTQGRLAVLIENARPDEENPVFTQALHEKLVEVFKEQKVKASVVPLAEVLKLRRQNPDFEQWNLQKVGRELGAEQVLYVRLERLNLRPARDHPLIEPFVEMRLKVIGVKELAKEARLWPGPKEREGREVKRARQIREASSVLAVDAEAAKLGHDAALVAAMPFYDVDTEAAVPWEP